jgi:hypothetical protein
MVDGISANDPSTEAGMAFPNLEAVDQFRVQTSSFSAENGRDPVQVTMVTKSGTNQFHGTLWEFLRNDKLDARNSFLVSKPYLRRNQYGFSVGGPIFKNKTFFFASFEGLRVRGQGGYNSPTIPSAFLQGDFSSLLQTDFTNPRPTAIYDWTTGQPFPANLRPPFFPHIFRSELAWKLLPGLAPQPRTDQLHLKLDQLINAKQKISARWIRVGDTQEHWVPAGRGEHHGPASTCGWNYDYTIAP